MSIKTLRESAGCTPHKSRTNTGPNEQSGTSSNHSKRDHQCSVSEADHIPRIKHTLQMRINTDVSITYRRQDKAREELPPKTDGAAQTSNSQNPQLRETTNSTSSAAVVLRTVERLPKGKPFRPQADSHRTERPKPNRRARRLWRNQAPTTAQSRRKSCRLRGQPQAAPAQAAMSNSPAKLPTTPRRSGKAANTEASASRPVRPTVKIGRAHV